MRARGGEGWELLIYRGSDAPPSRTWQQYQMRMRRCVAWPWNVSLERPLMRPR